MTNRLSDIQLLSDIPTVENMSDTVRVLFLHAALDHLSAEYKVHKHLAESSAIYGVESYFLWQRGARSTGDNAMSFLWPERVRYIDFGRDLSTSTLPRRSQRIRMLLRNLPFALLATLASVHQIRPDIIYTSQQNYDVRIAHLISRLYHIPHIVHLHYTLGPWLGTDVMHAICRTPHMIAVSEFIRQSALLRGVAPSSICTVPNAIGPESFYEGADRIAMRAEFGWEPNTPVVIAAGRLDPMKGHLQMIDVFASVLRRMPHARLLICGRTLTRSTYPDLVRQRVADLGIHHAVAFAGHRYDLPALMQASDVFALLSEMEPFGLVFLEAMAVGLPVVAYYSGAIPEIVVDGMTGLLSYPDRPDHLVDNLVKLLSNRMLAAQMGTAGRQRVISRFSPDAISQFWASTVRQFIGRTPAVLSRQR